MLQKTVQDMALKISQLERYTHQQQHTINNVVDKVNNEVSICSKSNHSIPGMIDTSGTPSASASSKLLTAQALIASLTSSLVEAEKNRYILRNKRRPGQGGDQPGPASRGRGGEQRERGVLREVNNEVDRQWT